jgi:hypothetical protein
LVVDLIPEASPWDRIAGMEGCHAAKLWGGGESTGLVVVGWPMRTLKDRERAIGIFVDANHGADKVRP